MATTKAAAAKSPAAKTAAPRTRRSPRKVTSSDVAVRARRAEAPSEPAENQQQAGTDLAAPSKASVFDKRDGVMTEMSEAWFQMARGGQVATLDALRKVVDVAIPFQGGDESRRRKLIDGAFDLADRVGAAQLGLTRGALQSAVLVYVDVGVEVNTDVDAFNGVDVGVDVNVPTDVGAFKHSNQL